MEILLLAAIAWAMGQQSEQSKLGLTPAHRAHLKEQHRHEKAVRKIADKHGPPPPGMADATGVSPWKEPTRSTAADVPDTFRSGYRRQRPSGPPLAHRAGVWAGQGVGWAQDTSRNAWQAYRDRRRKNGNDDPELVLVPVAPALPNAPPMPTSPPTVGVADDTAETVEPKLEGASQPGETSAPQPDGTAKPEPVQAEPEATAPAPANADPEPTPEASEPAATEPAVAAEPETTTTIPGGTGRMAAEVTYESVMEESDELSLMCEDDVRVYGRIRERAEREISRGDELIVKLQDAGFGAKVIGWVARCKEQYQVILGQLDDLEKNTIAQGEQVVVAKTLLEAGQGLYADIAKDMESVATRGSYTSDAVDGEDMQAQTETYETKAAA